MSDDEDHMVKISALIARLQSTMDQFGDTCVYIRRGGLAWGAVALNRRADDEKHGVFDLQAQHDRDLLQRAEQVERLIASRRTAETKLNAAVELIKAAGLMSNVCYNAKQNAEVPEGIRTWLANTQESFDKARDAYLAAVGGAKDA